MRTVIITGGIATGKSTAINYLKAMDIELVFFDSDKAVAALLDSGRIADELENAFGSASITPSRQANRKYLRELVFHNAEARKELESILHPRIREECLALQHDTVKNGRAPGFIIDIPLFYETGFDFGQDLVVVVSVSRETQKERLAQRNGFDDALINAMLEAQLPLQEKEKRADVILWNEGPLSWLEAQTKLLYHHYLI